MKTITLLDLTVKLLGFAEVQYSHQYAHDWLHIKNSNLPIVWNFSRQVI